MNLVETQIEGKETRTESVNVYNGKRFMDVSHNAFCCVCVYAYAQFSSCVVCTGRRNQAITSIVYSYRFQIRTHIDFHTHNSAE